MTIYVFGNPDIEQDSLPIRILPELKKQFPNLQFEIKDPNEEWDALSASDGAEELIVIDSVVGIDSVRVFENLKNFSNSPRVSMHDFDALANLLYLQKLGKLKKIKIIGIPVSPAGGPPMISEKKAVDEISAVLRSNQF